ncbi:MAG: hypothetical protein A3D65_04010 [Candidatus Lloydbacteria bacterium RIFCSPHIGHO2_02_FULL_50_13]|uniref:DUF922 domain-containing protein n=1 Tax=Candidatus Lloydbacteria bacterium RIFCSPHIGHO2_02_FULL_50_13 TaxID=1798661 RepID=A0A1G2D9T0_9BACT|nr:MAG: hypothetical protein A3D65_04010 [Candidatus Lloydbacteria bacterium RIFCSPHIGHO2_02_FULL_50_13]
MKKLLFILLIPFIIFAFGVVLVFVGGGLDALFSKAPSSPKVTSGVSPEDGAGAQVVYVPAPLEIGAPNVINVPTEYYTVTGATKEEVRASMAQAKKTNVFLEGHVGATSAQTGINFKRRQLADKCEAVLTQFDLRMGFIYPRWAQPPGASSEVIAAWGAFIAALIVHEEGHAKIELENITETFQALKQMSPYATCEEFDRAWQALAEKREREDRAEQARYDVETQSGKLQNVTF